MSEFVCRSQVFWGLKHILIGAQALILGLFQSLKIDHDSNFEFTIVKGDERR